MNDKFKQVMDKLDGLNLRGNCLFLHDWEKWKVVEQGTLAVDKKIQGFYEGLRRECRNCGDVQRKEAVSNIGENKKKKSKVGAYITLAVGLFCLYTILSNWNQGSKVWNSVGLIVWTSFMTSATREIFFD